MTETITTDAPVQAADSGKIVSPWLTLDEAATYAKRSPKTIRRACIEYQRHNDRGLRCSQPGGAGGHYNIHVTDVDRWIQGLAPSRVVHKTVP